LLREKKLHRKEEKVWHEDKAKTPRKGKRGNRGGPFEENQGGVNSNVTPWKVQGGGVCGKTGRKDVGQSNHCSEGEPKRGVQALPRKKKKKKKKKVKDRKEI